MYAATAYLNSTDELRFPRFMRVDKAVATTGRGR